MRPTLEHFARNMFRFESMPHYADGDEPGAVDEFVNRKTPIVTA